MCVCVWGCQYFMMWLTLSTEHEQTLSDSTVYQWNIPLPFPSPRSPSLSPPHHSLCPTLLLCLSILISVLPSVSRSIFHFRFNLFDVLSLLLRRHLSLPFLSSSTGLSICRPRPLSISLSLSHEINMPLYVVATCQSSYDSQQNVHSCGPCVYVCLRGGLSKCI